MNRRSRPGSCQQLPELLVLLPLSVLGAMSLSLLALAAADEQPPPWPITLHPHCTDKCGNISIPYPFGVEPGCFLDGFQVNCNHSFDPPRLFLAFDSSSGSQQLMANATLDYSVSSLYDTTPTEFLPVELIDISLDRAEVRAFGMVRSICITPDGNYSIARFQTTALDGPFMLAAGRNTLVGVGWSVQVDLGAGLGSRVYAWSASGTYLKCEAESANDQGYVNDKECLGFGCCQQPVETGSYTDFGVHFLVAWLRSNADCPCAYGMLVESSFYTFSAEDVFHYDVLPKKYPRGVPFVIDFAIRNGSCPVAGGPPPPPDYACRSSNSVCVNATSGGYLCKCSDNYQGNPYIPNGCQGTYVRCCFCCCEQQKTLNPTYAYT